MVVLSSMPRIQLQKFTGITLITLLTIAFHFLGWLHPVESVLRSIINPGSTLLYNVSEKIQKEQLPFSSADELVDSYKKLQEEVDQYKQKLVQFDILKEENTELRDQLKFFASSTYEHIGAEVVGKNIEPLANTIVLSRGEKDGVHMGDPVIARGGILVGKILRVEHDISIARLINDHQSIVAATILNQNKSIGLVEGGYGISVRMNFIPQNELIAPGDTVITSGLEKQIPRGLIIGIVQTVEKEAYEPFQQAVLTPGIELDKIFTVSILTNISQPTTSTSSQVIP